MCRLFGLHAGRDPVRATFWLLDAPDNLAAQSRRNPDGTGLGVFDADGHPDLRKQPMAAWEDRAFHCEAHQMIGTTFLAHVRYATTGSLEVANTHPFLQDNRMFAHNGVVQGLPDLDRRLGELGVSDLVAGQTDSERVRLSRRIVLEFLASSVDVSTAPALQGYLERYVARPGRFGPAAANVSQPPKIDNDLYVRDYAKCILCYKCVEACGTDAQNTFAIAVAGRGFSARIATEFDVPLPDSACVYCGNCIGVCPTGALMVKTEYDMRQSGTWDESRQAETEPRDDHIDGHNGMGRKGAQPQHLIHR